MGLFDMLKGVASKKLAKATESSEYKPQRTPVPNGMHQGSVVEISDVVHALARADGSIINDIDLSQQITSVGRYTLFGRSVFNCYLSDATSMLRVVTKGEQILEVALFVMRDEILPANSDEWAFWLGTYQGSKIKEHGLIGWPSFQVDTTPPTLYTRSWTPGDQGVEPVKYTETVVDLSGESTRVTHEAMEYWRQLGDDVNTTEMVFVTAAACGNDAAVNVYVGIPLKNEDIKILAVH